MSDITEWCKEFGKEPFVPFETFCKIFEATLPPNVTPQDVTGLLYPLLNLIEGTTFTDSEQVTPEMYNLILHLFGPKDKVVLRVKDVVEHGYFHGELSGEQCKELLHHPGNFLFRMRKASSQLAIAYANQDGTVKHLLISMSNGKYMLIKNEYHDTLAEIVLKYANKLKTPILLDIKGKYSKKTAVSTQRLLSPHLSPKMNFALPPAAQPLSGTKQTPKKPPPPLNAMQKVNRQAQKDVSQEAIGIKRSTTQPQIAQQQPAFSSPCFQQSQQQQQQQQQNQMTTSFKLISAPQNPPPTQQNYGNRFTVTGAQQQESKQYSQQQPQQRRESLRQSAPQFPQQHLRTLSHKPTASIQPPSSPTTLPRTSEQIPPFHAPSPHSQRLAPPQQQAPLPSPRQNGMNAQALQSINPYNVPEVESEYTQAEEEFTDDCRECEMSKFYTAQVYRGHVSTDIAVFNKDKWIMELTTNLDFFSEYCQALPYPSQKQIEKAKLIVFDLFSVFPDLPNESFAEELGNLFSQRDLVAIVATMSDVIMNGIPKETFI